MWEMENNSRERQSLEFFQKRGIREFLSFDVKGHGSSKCMNASKNHKGKHVEHYCLKTSNNLTAQIHTMDRKENISSVIKIAFPYCRTTVVYLPLFCFCG